VLRYKGKLYLLAFILAACTSVPLLSIYASFLSFEVSNWRHLIDTVLTAYVVNSLILMLGVGLGTTLLGTSLAWCIVRYRFVGRSTLQWLVLLPLAMPAYIVAYAYTGLLDFSGPVQSWIRARFELGFNQYWFPEVRSLTGAIVLMSLVLYPYVYLLARTAFKLQSSHLEEVSKLANKSSLQHILRVSLPLARPAILIGAILAMMEALADFGTVEYFGISTLTTGIYRTWFGMGDINTASQLSALLCTFVFVLLFLEFSSRAASQAYQTKYQQKNLGISLPWPRGILVLVICSLPVLFGFVIPFGLLSSWSIQYTQSGSLAEFAQLVINTAWLAVVGASIIVSVALVISYAKRRNNGAVLQFASRFVSLGYAMPGTVVAIGILAPMGWLDKQINGLTLYFNDSTVGLIFSGSVIVLLFAYLVRFVSIALQYTDSGLQRIPNSLDEVSLSLKKTPRQSFFNVHLPLMSASVISAFLLVFVDILKELPATLVLRPFDFNTLAVKAFELASDERLIEAALPSVSIVLVGLLPVILLTKTLERS